MSEASDLERLSTTNLAMEAVVPLVLQQGGSAARFTDCSIVALFEGADHEQRGVTAAFKARSHAEHALRDAVNDGSVGGVRTALASGEVFVGAVGARTLRRMEFVVSGRPLRSVQRLVEEAEAGQVVADPSLVDRLGGTFE